MNLLRPNTGPFCFNPEQRRPYIAVLIRNPDTGELRPRDPTLTLEEVMARNPTGTIVVTREIVSPDGTRRAWFPSSGR